MASTRLEIYGRLLCCVEWVLSVGMIYFASGSLIGLFSPQIVGQILFNTLYPRHYDDPNGDGEGDSLTEYQIILLIEGIALVLIQIILTSLLTVGLFRVSAVICKVWVMIQIALTLMISGPLLYHYSTKYIDNCHLMSQEDVITFIFWMCWILYRFVTILVVRNIRDEFSTIQNGVDTLGPKEFIPMNKKILSTSV